MCIPYFSPTNLRYSFVFGGVFSRVDRYKLPVTRSPVFNVSVGCIFHRSLYKRHMADKHRTQQSHLHCNRFGQSSHTTLDSFSVAATTNLLSSGCLISMEVVHCYCPDLSANWSVRSCHIIAEARRGRHMGKYSSSDSENDKSSSRKGITD